MSEFVIFTEKDDYTGGETVRGKAVLTVDSPVIARGIRLKFEGFEKSHWVVGSGKNQRTYSERRVFFSYEETLWGKEPLSVSELMKDFVKGIFTKSHYDVVQPGMYEYDFSFELPQNLPPDYESGHRARIAYELTAYVDIPLKFDIECVKKLTVYQTYDYGEVRPVSSENSKTFLFDSSNPMELKATIDSNMYYPGDCGGGIVEIINHSSKRIDAITVSLAKKVHQKAYSASTESEVQTELFRLDSPDVRKGARASFKFEFTIPEDTYCTILSAELLTVQYELVVNLDVPWAIDLETRLPITILEEAGVPSGVGGGQDGEI